jgi:hypothetical protein
MPETSEPHSSHFKVFRSAAEEIPAASEREVSKGGHTHAKSGRIVQVSPDNLKVVFTHEDGEESEQSCETMQEGEAIIRRNTPTPPEEDGSSAHEETAAGGQRSVS